MDAAASPAHADRDGARAPQAGDGVAVPVDEHEAQAVASLNERLVSYLKGEDLARIEEARVFATEAHRGQFRVSGEPYITHPLSVAGIVADWHLDARTIIAALLHDVMEDTQTNKPEIAERFGAVTADMVDGLSKLDKMEFSSKEEAQAENFRKMLLAMTTDLRVILIKLADRLHNMRTLDAVRPDKQRRIATETLEIYAPIANRLGLNAVFRELQELSFRYKYPMRYGVLRKSMQAARGNRSELIVSVLGSVREILPTWEIEAEVMGREKHLFSIYRKMIEKRLDFAQVLDIFGVRVIVEDVAACYRAIGALHALYKPVPGKFKDYIALPKGNGYQSLHTTLIGPFGTPIEVQVRTQKMHHVAESGVASHWLYKEEGGGSGLSDLQQKTHSWLQSLVELQSASNEATEFLEHVKIDLFPQEVYVFSPKGRIFSLPRGSTPVDFAYAVHTDIGNRAVACRINNDLMPLRTRLQNGDQVEIITAIHANPNPAWLNYVRSGKARAQIRNFLKNAQHAEASVLGERLLSQALQAHQLSLLQIGMASWERYLSRIELKSRRDLFAEIGLGERLPAIVARDLAHVHLNEDEDAGGAEKPGTVSAIPIRGGEGTAIQLASCCQPIPGDAIIGRIRQGKGLEVHRAECGRIGQDARIKSANWIDVEWEAGVDNAPPALAAAKLYPVTVRVQTHEGLGVLAAVANAVSRCDCNIQDVVMDRDERYYFMSITLQVRDRVHLAAAIRAVRAVPSVVRLTRTGHAADQRVG